MNIWHILVDRSGIEAGSLRVQSQDFVFGLEKEVAVRSRVQFAEREWDDSSPGQGVLITALTSLVLLDIFYLERVEWVLGF